MRHRRFIVIVILIGFIGLMSLFIATIRHNRSLTTWTPSSPALIAAIFVANGCTPQPCWHSLHPGVTTRDQARTVLLQDSAITNVAQTSYGSLSFDLLINPNQNAAKGESIAGDAVFSAIGTLINVALRLDPSAADLWLRVGDAVTYLGQPTAYHNGYPFYRSVALDFDHHVRLVASPDSPSNYEYGLPEITPGFVVSSITFAQQFSSYGPESCTLPWQGFGGLQIIGCL
jgi:hypothetical protein